MNRMPEVLRFFGLAKWAEVVEIDPCRNGYQNASYALERLETAVTTKVAQQHPIAANPPKDLLSARIYALREIGHSRISLACKAASTAWSAATERNYAKTGSGWSSVLGYDLEDFRRRRVAFADSLDLEVNELAEAILTGTDAQRLALAERLGCASHHTGLRRPEATPDRPDGIYQDWHHARLGG